jgi:hypothetical protein
MRVVSYTSIICIILLIVTSLNISSLRLPVHHINAECGREDRENIKHKRKHQIQSQRLATGQEALTVFTLKKIQNRTPIIQRPFLLVRSSGMNLEEGTDSLTMS